MLYSTSRGILPVAPGSRRSESVLMAYVIVYSLPVELQSSVARQRTMSNKSTAVILLLFASTLVGFSDSVVKRCFSCRSRGDLGSCKDRFKYTNLTQVSLESGIGVEAVPCASGWCGKIIETRNSDAKEQEFDTATQRTCLQRGPSDGEERCDDTMWEYKKVFMCFCHGDLCNGATSKTFDHRLLTLTLAIPVVLARTLI